MSSKTIDQNINKIYTLSSDYTIFSKQQWNNINAKHINPKETVGIYSKKKDRVFIVNNIMGDLIKSFKKPVNAESALMKFSKKLALQDKKSQRKLLKLFQDLVRKNILIAEDKEASADILPLLKPYPIGTKIGQYELVKRLNSNDYLHVFLAKNKSNKSFILKLYPESKILTKELRTNLHATLYREITILHYLKDDLYINKVLAYNNKKHFAVLDFFKGQSVKDLVKSNKKGLTFQKTMEITSQIIDALKWIHSKKYVHGDIHDKNIMVDSSYKIQFIDFGLAMHESEEEIKNFRRGGIHVFMPPERIKNDVFSFIHKNPNFCSDVYQIGIILYILFYHKTPFSADTWKQKTKKIKSGSIRFYKYCYDKTLMPPHLIEFIKKCIDKNPEQRFSSGIAMDKAWKKLKLS